MPGLTFIDGLEVGTDLGHFRQRGRAQLEGAGAEVVFQRRIEDAAEDVLGVFVGHLGRVETGLGDLEGIAQHLVLGLRSQEGRGQHKAGQQGVELHREAQRTSGKSRSLVKPSSHAASRLA